VIYEWIGRLVVRFVLHRYRRQIKVGIALVVLSLLFGGYLAASREPAEG
jgi:hypothetical protein